MLHLGRQSGKDSHGEATQPLSYWGPREVLDGTWDSAGWGCVGLKICLVLGPHAQGPKNSVCRFGTSAVGPQPPLLPWRPLCDPSLMAVVKRRKSFLFPLKKHPINAARSTRVMLFEKLEKVAIQ